MTTLLQGIATRPVDLIAAAGDIAGRAFRAPLTVLEHEANAVRDLAQVIAGRSDIAPAPGDRRFGGEGWQQNPFHKRYMQSTWR
jgi:polyhydroxyalkanoate synthase